MTSVMGCPLSFTSQSGTKGFLWMCGANATSVGIAGVKHAYISARAMKPAQGQPPCP
jgi:hypothetical protein